MIIETQLVIIESELMIYFRMQEKMCFDARIFLFVCGSMLLLERVRHSDFRVWMRLIVSL